MGLSVIVSLHISASDQLLTSFLSVKECISVLRF